MCGEVSPGSCRRLGVACCSLQRRSTINVRVMIEHAAETAEGAPKGPRRADAGMAEEAVLEDSVCSEDDIDSEATEPEFRPRKRGPNLYSEAQIARLTLRYHVGDVVKCTMDEGKAEGTILQRFYREKDWPRGYYAAVRRPI